MHSLITKSLQNKAENKLHRALLRLSRHAIKNNILQLRRDMHIDFPGVIGEILGNYFSQDKH